MPGDGSCGVGLRGWIVGESDPSRSLVIFDKSGGRPRAGEYLVAQGEDGCMLGIVENIWTGHRMLPPSVTDPIAVNRIAEWTLSEELDDTYTRGSVRWLSLLEPLVEYSKVVSPKTPAVPGTPVYSVDERTLRRVFAPEGRSWIDLGVLASNPGVPFRVDANALSRHLAILAVTGGGKSNTVCILAKRIVGGLGGTMAVFDMHGEYTRLGIRARLRKHSPPKLNPAAIHVEEFYKLLELPANASHQMRYARWAWKVSQLVYYKARGGRLASPDIILPLAGQLLETLYDVGRNRTVAGELRNATRPEYQAQRKGLPAITEDAHQQGLRQTRSFFRRYFSDHLADLVVDVMVEYKLLPPRNVKEDSLDSLLMRFEDMLEKYGEVLDPKAPIELERIIPPGHLTVFDLSSLDERAADAVVSHYLRRILYERKMAKTRGDGYPVPILTVIEEAHVLVPRESSTLTKYWAGRIAREGRKFGVGLVLVSQRPKNVDSNVLSQTNNKIVLRIVEPEDIRYVQRASEELSDDLASLLPSLNPGEAIIIGRMARLPALVKIEECPPEEKPVGGDIPLVREWERYRANAENDLDLLSRF